MIDRFQSDSSKIFAFLLSTRAGGQGINLTAADTVILHDLDWNPALDRQAEDRVHRLGQKRQVAVYRLVTSGSVEESIVKMQRRKKGLGDTLLDTKPASADAKAAEAVEVDDDFEGDEAAGGDNEAAEGSAPSKLDSSLMSELLEHALGLASQQPPRPAP